MFPNSIKQDHSKSFDGINAKKIELSKYSKLYCDNKIIDPISGETRIYKIERPKLEHLDTKPQIDKLTNEFNSSRIQDYQRQKKSLKATDNIAGSLRKEVPYLPYVNPFTLKSAFKNQDIS